MSNFKKYFEMARLGKGIYGRRRSFSSRPRALAAGEKMPRLREATPEEVAEREAREIKFREEGEALKKAEAAALIDVQQNGVDLGWANGWRETPDIVKDCDHKTISIPDKSGRGYENTVVCPVCKYIYRYDSSD